MTKAEQFKPILAEYATTGADVIEMVDITPSTAIIMMVGADDAFNALRTELDAEIAAWRAAGQDSFEDADAASHTTTNLFLIISLAATVVAFVVSFFVSTFITKPINALNGTMLKLADGDTGVDVAGAERKDEIGGMAQAVQVFKENMIANTKMETERLQQHKTQQAHARAIEELTRTFDQDAGRVLKDVEASADTMETTSQDMTGLAAQTTGQAANTNLHKETSMRPFS